MTIEKRIELLNKKIFEADFLKGRGLGNEIPFWIFDYPPENELLIRYSIKKLMENSQKKSLNFLEIDLFELCLEILNNKIDHKKITEFESKKGSDLVLEKLKLILKPDSIGEKIKEKMELCGIVDVVLLTGIGKAWPLIRSHSVLNNLQSMMGNTPLIAFYPGKYDNSVLSLFGKFKDANYYRAFRIVNESNV